MTIQKGDKAVLRTSERAKYRQFEGGPLSLSMYANYIRPDHELTVSQEENRLGNVRVFHPGTYSGPTRTASIHRSLLLRVFNGGFREGDKVISAALGITGEVVDVDPTAAEIDRTLSVPVKVVTRGNNADSLLKVGEVVYTDPAYLTKSTPVTRAEGRLYIAPQLPKLPEFPRVKLDGWFPENLAMAFGGQGGQGGAAVGPGAVGGRGGNGGSAHIHIPSNHDGPVGIDLSVPDPTPSPAYKDITEEVAGQWSRVAIGDIVTAKHRTQAHGAQVTNERTAEVVKDDRGGWGSGDIFWAELNLTMHSRYDAHKITRVLRLQKPKLLSERRKPLKVTVTRIVPADHVWSATTLRSEGTAYVEADSGGNYWLVFEGGQHSGLRLRLKEGRDAVQYESIPGTFVVRENFESLVALTHHPE
jgi:hypothetical protein